MDINSLDDNLLLEIMSHMDPLHLVHIAATCKRFKRLAEHRFHVAYKSLDFDTIMAQQSADDDIVSKGDDRTTSVSKEDGAIATKAAVMVLNTFGSLIECLAINGDTFFVSNSSRLLKAINDSCSEKLQRLKLTKIAFDPNDLPSYVNLFKPLKAIILDECIGNDETIGKCLAQAEKLKELQIILMVKAHGDFLKEVSPSLESLMIKLANRMRGENVLKLFDNCHQLKTLKILQCICGNSTFYEEIIRRVPNIEHLTFECSNFVDEAATLQMPFLDLPKIKRIEIRGFWHVLVPFVDKLSTKPMIQHFGVTFFDLTDDFCDALSKAVQLKSLRFACVGELKPKYLKQMGSNLKNLNTFSLIKCNFIPFNDILALVEHSISLEKLVILYSQEALTIDDNQFSELIAARKKTAKQRSTDAPLKVYLSPWSFAQSSKLISQQSLRSNRNIVKIHVLPPDELYDNKMDYLTSTSMYDDYYDFDESP